MNSSQTLRAHAIELVNHGLVIAPAIGKGVLVPAWTSRTAEEFFGEDIRKFWDDATGLGLICGPKSGIIALDIDLLLSECDPELLNKIVSKLPPIMSGKAGHPDKRPTQFFQYNGEENRKFNNIHVEILSSGSQTIIPPSKHPDFDKNYEWIGIPLNQIHKDELPYLPEGLIDYLDDLNESMRPQKNEADKTLIKAVGRCKSGSHNKLSALALALFHEKYPFDRLVKRMIQEDKKINYDADYYYFECPTRKWKNKSIEQNAGDFVEQIFKNYGPGGKKEVKREPEFNNVTVDDIKSILASENQEHIKPETTPAVKKTDEIELLPLKDLLERPDEKTQYLVENLLPAGGTSIVAAKPKCGKTTLLRQLSLDVSRGELFLNRITSKGPVIYFSVEEKIDEIKSHFKDMGAEGNEEIYIFANRAPKDTLKKLKPIVEKIKPSLIILDTLFKIIRMKDANDYAAISEALEPIQELARTSGAHIMCVHHAGKADREGADGILGSTAILAAFDTAIIMNRNSEKRTIKSIQRYGTDLEESALLFDKSTRRSSLGQENWKVKIEERTAEVANYVLSVGQKVSFADIKQATGMDQKILRKTLETMVKKHLLYVSGQGTKNSPYMFSSSMS